MTAETYEKFKSVFWWAFVLVPLFTGFLRYDWLPNESYDSRVHELVSSRSVDTNPVGGSEEKALTWVSKKTGEVFTRDSFSTHRHNECIRIGIISFLYGIFGCSFFAYGQVLKKTENTFFSALKAYWGYSLIAPIFFGLSTWW